MSDSIGLLPPGLFPVADAVGRTFGDAAGQFAARAGEAASFLAVFERVAGEERTESADAEGRTDSRAGTRFAERSAAGPPLCAFVAQALQPAPSAGLAAPASFAEDGAGESDADSRTADAAAGGATEVATRRADDPPRRSASANTPRASGNAPRAYAVFAAPKEPGAAVRVGDDEPSATSRELMPDDSRRDDAGVMTEGDVWSGVVPAAAPAAIPANAPVATPANAPVGALSAGTTAATTATLTGALTAALISGTSAAATATGPGVPAGEGGPAAPTREGGRSEPLGADVIRAKPGRAAAPAPAIANASRDAPPSAHSSGRMRPDAVVRDMDALDPAFRRPLTRVISRLREEGIQVRVAETTRTQGRQEALYAQGRTDPGPIVTWTRNSRHRSGAAADLIVDGPEGSARAYERMHAIAADEGLRTLGPRDPGHVELARQPAAPFAPADATRVAAPRPAAVPDAALPAQPLPRADVVQRVARVSELLTARNVASPSSITMHAADANGDLTRIVVSLRGSALQAAIRTASSAHAAELSSASGQLHEALADLGLRADAITIRHAATSVDSGPATRERMQGQVVSASSALADREHTAGMIFAGGRHESSGADDDRPPLRHQAAESRNRHRPRRDQYQERE
ncbi:MAG: hypothetical protein IT356_06215 [Gemmatimonadaceae bacterium]|nr:hypothetical protein [Gemmatimonadaceae bacterium]